jgi:hypothetical protein
MSTTATIIHTPGEYYAIAYWLSCNLIICCSPRKLNIKNIAIVQSIFLIVLLTIMINSDDKSNAVFVPLIILYVMIIYGDIFINCKYDAKTAFHFASRAFIIGEFMASFEWQIFYYTINNWNIPLNRITEIVFLISIHFIMYSILYFLEKKNHEINNKLHINTREMSSTIIISLVVFVMSNFSYIFKNSPFSSQFVSEIFFIRTLVDMGGVAILFAYHMQLGELKVRFEVEKLQNILNMQYNNYEMLEKSISAVNQKYHDLKYQIALLKQETSEGKRVEYLNQMEKEIKSYEAQNKTGNRVLDTILTGKSLYCQQNCIELTSVADGKAVDFMDDIDISTLFGNALDNAIESTSKIKDKERRLIHVVILKKNHFLRVRIENCYDEELVFVNGLPQTTKGDRKYHGYGLKSIENTVKKYEGSVTIQAEKGWFELRILIPVSEQELLNN